MFLRTLHYTLTVTLGFWLGIATWIFVGLPLLYGFPRGLFDLLRGRVSWWAPASYLVSTLIYVAIFFAMGYVMASLRLDHWLADAGIVLGNWMGICFAIIRCLLPKGRSDLRADYFAQTNQINPHAD